MFSFPPNIYSAFAKEIADFELLSEEKLLLDPMSSDKRRKEFTLGRLAAHQVFEAAGLSKHPPLLSGASGEPLWPEGFLGSITHTKETAICILSRNTDYSALGIDLCDLNREISSAISKRICTKEELLWTEHDPLKILQVFSAKEAIYKALFPIVGKYFGFDAVTLNLSTGENKLDAKLNTPLSESFPSGFSFSVRSCIQNQYLLSSVCLANPIATSICCD